MFQLSHLESFDEILEEGYDISRPVHDEDPLSIFPPSLKLLITLLVLPESSLPPTVKPSKLEKFVAHNEFPKQWLSFLAAVLEQRSGQYNRTVSEDKQIIDVYKQRLGSGMWLTNQQATRRKLMAVSVRVGEKEILEHASGVLEQLWQPVVGGKRKAEGRESGASTPKKGRH